MEQLAAVDYIWRVLCLKCPSTEMPSRFMYKQIKYIITVYYLVHLILFDEVLATQYCNIFFVCKMAFLILLYFQFILRVLYKYYHTQTNNKQKVTHKQPLTLIILNVPVKMVGVTDYFCSIVVDFL